MFKRKLPNLFFLGMPAIVIPLPSRRERCRFTLRPIGNTLQDLCDSVQTEDRGVDYMVAHTLGMNSHILFYLERFLFVEV